MATFEVGQAVVITSHVVDMYGNVGKEGVLLFKHAKSGMWRVKVDFSGTQSDTFDLDETEMVVGASAAQKPPATETAADAGEGERDDPAIENTIDYWRKIAADNLALAATNARLLENAQSELNTRIRELAVLEGERNRLRGQLTACQGERDNLRGALRHTVATIQMWDTDKLAVDDILRMALSALAHSQPADGEA